MFFLGILSLIQIGFLPGFLVVRGLRLKPGFIGTFLLSFSASLVINHLMIILLTTVGVYNGTSMYSIFFAEVALLLWLVWSRHAPPAARDMSLDTHRLKALITTFQKDKPFSAGVQWCVFFLALGTILYFAVKSVQTWGEIFSSWDAVVSWNRWAVDWFNGNFPSRTWHYPQLLPSVWSVTYTFIGDSSVQFFARALMSLFALLTLLILVDLALEHKDLSYLFGVSVTGFLYTRLIRDEFLFGGYADIAVGFMAFASVYVLISSMNTDKKSVFKKLVFGALLASGAALTKQAGLAVAVLYPVLVYLIVLRKMPGLTRKNKISLITAIVFVIVMTAVPWYVFTEIRISQGIEISEVPTITDTIHKGRTHWERLAYGLKLLKRQTGTGLLIFGALCCTITVVRRNEWRYVLLLLALPFFFIWGLYFSYDLRNLSLALPFAGTGTALAFPYIEQKVSLTRAKVRGRGRIFLLGGAALGLILLTGFLDDNFLRNRQMRLQKQIGNPFVNNMIYQYQVRNGLKGKIITDYFMLEHLPYMKEYYVQSYMKTLDALIAEMLRPDTRYVLITVPPPRNIETYIAGKMMSGHLRQITHQDPILFVEIMK